MKQSTGMSITSLPVITMRELCKFNIPLNCEIHVGSEDWQSNPDSVLEFAKLTGMYLNLLTMFIPCLKLKLFKIKTLKERYHA